MREPFVSFRKIFTSRGFWLCVGMTVLLLFAAEVYTDFDTQDRYSVFRAITSLSREELCAHRELCDVMVIQNSRGGWFTLFAPIITAFCFVPTMCAEREENAVRFQIFRTSKLKYSVSKFLSGVIAGGAAVTLGYVIFSGAASVLFPSVLHNKYLIMCIPFFAKYALSQTVQKVSQDMYSDFENVDETMRKFINTVNPDGLLWITYAENHAAALFFGITAAVFFAMFIIIIQKRGDCGA